MTGSHHFLSTATHALKIGTDRILQLVLNAVDGLYVLQCRTVRNIYVTVLDHMCGHHPQVYPFQCVLPRTASRKSQAVWSRTFQPYPFLVSRGHRPVHRTRQAPIPWWRVPSAPRRRASAELLQGSGWLSVVSACCTENRPSRRPVYPHKPVGRGAFQLRKVDLTRGVHGPSFHRGWFEEWQGLLWLFCYLLAMSHVTGGGGY